MWPSRSSKNTMPLPDPPLHPKGLSIPMTQTLTPSSHPLTLPQVIPLLQIPLQTMIWTTLNPVRHSPLMTPPLSTSWTPILPLTLSIKPTSTMCLNTPLLIIDRGANGGLAGFDVRILERTGRTVSVTGIDNH